jgi:hypothetical protein
LLKTNFLKVVTVSPFCGVLKMKERMSPITVSGMTQPAASRIEEIFIERYQPVYRAASVITRNPEDAGTYSDDCSTRRLA